ncbi:MBL fold metallo-hydrolase [Saccharothrix isguenensis]
MPWTVDIHHMTVNGAGDATLIVARCPAGSGRPPQFRTVLIDCGSNSGFLALNNYFNTVIPARPIDVLAITHFDDDHFGGFAGLLGIAGTTRFDNTLVYDVGQLPTARLQNTTQDQHGNKVANNSDYHYYRQAAIGATRRHVTRNVNSFWIASYDVNDAPILPTAANSPLVAGYLSPDWLLGKDIMWGNGLTGAGGEGPWAENPPAGAPTLRCIAANKWVEQVADGPRFVSAVDIYDGYRKSDQWIANQDSAKKQDNEKSLAFLLEFNGFRYYVGGDIYRLQEDGGYARNVHPPQWQPGIRTRLNPNGTAAGRVLAMKTSHHGSDTSSSADFLHTMRPAAAFISVGERNKYKHPHPNTMNALDGYPEVPFGANKANLHPAAPPPPPRPPIPNYLTGYQDPASTPPESYGGDQSIVAGPPDGWVKLRVTEDQSRLDSRGQLYRGVFAVVNAMTAPLTRVFDPLVIAEAAVMYGPLGACAVAMVLPPTIAENTLLMVAQTGDKINDQNGVVPGLVTTGVARAAFDSNPVHVANAVAGVSPGAATRCGPGTAAVIGAAVTGQQADRIAAAATSAIPPASAAAAGAAGVAGATAYTRTDGTPAGYAAVTALAAAGHGADQAQAAVLGAIVGALAAQSSANDTTLMVTTAALAAGMHRADAAILGAVAGASARLGSSYVVTAAVRAALGKIGYPSAGITTITKNAGDQATQVPPALFSVTYLGGNKAITHNG